MNANDARNINLMRGHKEGYPRAILWAVMTGQPIIVYWLFDKTDPSSGLAWLPWTALALMIFFIYIDANKGRYVRTRTFG